MVDGYNTTVIRTPLVSAHAEQKIQFAFQRNEESARRAWIAIRCFGGQRFRSARSLIPAFRGLGTTQRREHVPAGQIEFLNRLVDVLCGGHRCYGILVLRTVNHVSVRSGIVAAVRRFDGLHIVGNAFGRLNGLSSAEPLFHTWIIGIGADRIGHRQIGRFKTILPWNPFRWAQRLVGRHQR